MMGMGGVAGQPGMWNGAGVPPVAMTDGSVRAVQTANSSSGTSSYISPYMNLTVPAPAGTPAAPQGGTQPSYFAPSKLTDQLAAHQPQKPDPAPEKLSEPSARSVQGQGKEGRDKPPAKVEGQPGPRKIVIRTGEIEYEVALVRRGRGDHHAAPQAHQGRLHRHGQQRQADQRQGARLRRGARAAGEPRRADPRSAHRPGQERRAEEPAHRQPGHHQAVHRPGEPAASRPRHGRATCCPSSRAARARSRTCSPSRRSWAPGAPRIEEIEGELRYYANQVALSTLTITLYEKEIAAPFGIVERERVQMGVEVEDVDQAMQAAQKAVREAKGRITKSELKQPSQGQFSAILDFEVPPDAAGLLRDRFKQLGTVARLRHRSRGGDRGRHRQADRRQDQTQRHAVSPASVQPDQRGPARDGVHQPGRRRCRDRPENAAGAAWRRRRAGSSPRTSTRRRAIRRQGDLQFQVKTAEADGVLADIKSAGEVMRLQVTENTNVQDTTRKKRGFHVQLRALGAARRAKPMSSRSPHRTWRPATAPCRTPSSRPRAGCSTPSSTRRTGRNRRATLDFEVRRAEEPALRAALATAGDIYTREVTRAAGQRERRR